MEIQTIDWNEASKRGLIVRINNEILHPLGLAMCRNVEDGTSPHLLVSDDGVWVYEHPAPVAIDETAEFLKAWPEISKHGIDNGWRGVAIAAWNARAALSGGKYAG